MKLLRSLVLALGLLLPVAAMAVNPADIPTVQTIAELKLKPVPAQYPDIQVLGYYTANDGGGGLVHWSASNTDTPDNAYVFQATGVTTGRWFRNLSAPLNLYQCGVKADGTTDNSTRIQACFNTMATYNLGEIDCPASAGKIAFTSSITPVGGGIFRGQNNTIRPYLGDLSAAPGACYLKWNGATGYAFDFQTPFQSITPCPSTVGPKFYNFTLEQASTGNGFRINNNATAGFSDDCVGTGGGQSVVLASVFQDIVTTSQQRGTTAIQVNKAFDTNIINNVFSFYDTQVDVEGSDNVLIQDNKFNFATLREVDLQSHGTFGNFNTVRDNTFFTVYFNATDFLRSSARSGVIDGNYFEADFNGITSMLNITCGLAQTITNNAMELAPANVTYWLKVTGDCISITLTNNYNGGGGEVASNWNAGSGSHWNANSSKQKIVSVNNPDNNDRTPYTTFEPIPKNGNNAPAVSGSVLGSFDSTSAENIGGDGIATIWIGPAGHSGDFELQPKTGGVNGHMTFKMRPTVVATVDTWVLAYSGSGSSQTFVCSVGASGGITITLTGGTTPTWYNPAGLANLAVNDPLFDCVNSDTTHGQFAYISKWQLVKH